MGTLKIQLHPYLILKCFIQLYVLGIPKSYIYSVVNGDTFWLLLEFSCF
jgi:hypothetical protein